MANPYFRFKQFTVYHDRCAMKVTTDGCLFGAWCAVEIEREVAQYGSEHSTSPRILDIGSGTGLLSLMIAQKAAARIDAVEIDPEASRQSQENVTSSPFSSRINIVQEDVKQVQAGQHYDIIVSNPPFYENEITAATDTRNIAHHSSHLKFEDLMHVTSRHLGENGTIYLLLPYKRLAGLERSITRHGYHIHKKILLRQTPLHDPFRAMLQLRKQPAQTYTETIAIRENNDEYSAAFTALLKDYYLYL